MSPDFGMKFPFKINKYLVLKLIGEGCFGKVYKAVDEETFTEYAIKRIDLSDMNSY